MKPIIFILCLALAGCATAGRAPFNPATASTQELYKMSTEGVAWTYAGLAPIKEARREYGRRMGWGDDGTQKIEFGGAYRPGVLDRPIPLTKQKLQNR